MSICQAIMRSGNPCWQNAKYGTFCGRHNPEKPVIEHKTCQGITKCGDKCKKIIKFGDVCNAHLHSEVPDNFQLSLYQPDVNWPNMWLIQHKVKKFNNGKDLNNHINNRVLRIGHDNFYEPDYLELVERAHFCKMVIAELFFRNFYLDFNTPHWQAIIIETQLYLKDYPFMNAYREHFRKKFDNAYRIETQKKYIGSVLNQSVLEKNSVKKIVSFL